MKELNEYLANTNNVAKVVLGAKGLAVFRAQSPPLTQLVF